LINHRRKFNHMTNESPKTKKKINYPRLTTAAGVGLVVLGAIYYGPLAIASLLGLIAIFGGFELKNIVDAEGGVISKFLHIGLATVPILYFGSGSAHPQIFQGTMILSVIIMIVLIANLWGDAIPYNRIKYPFAFFYWGVPFGLATYYIFNANADVPLMFLGVILLLWTSDTMAYFTGKAFGKNKLFPSVSPGKTREGSLGAGFFSMVVAGIYAYVTDQSIFQWLIIGVVVWIIGTLGDLVESKIKRVQHVKDSGSILPGHGGFLDRFDSLVMVLPFLIALDYYFS